MQSIRKYANIDNTDRRDAVIFRSLRFLPRQYCFVFYRASTLMHRTVWFGGWMLTWATALESVLNRAPTQNRFDLANYPRSVNAFFIFIPVFFFSLTFTFVGIADARWKESLAMSVPLFLRDFALADLLRAATTNLSLHSPPRLATSSRQYRSTSSNCKRSKLVSLAKRTR